MKKRRDLTHDLIYHDVNIILDGLALVSLEDLCRTLTQSSFFPPNYLHNLVLASLHLNQSLPIIQQLPA